MLTREQQEILHNGLGINVELGNGSTNLQRQGEMNTFTADSKGVAITQEQQASAYRFKLFFSLRLGGKPDTIVGCQ